MPPVEDPALAAISAELEAANAAVSEATENLATATKRRDVLAEAHGILVAGLAAEAKAAPVVYAPPSPPPSPPSTPRRSATEANRERAEKIAEIVRQSAGPAAARDIRAALRGAMSETQIGKALREAVSRELIVATGKGAGTRYSPAISADRRARQVGDPGKNGSLEGRILGFLGSNPRSNLRQIASAAGAPEPDIAATVGKLMREGEVAAERRAGQIVYRTA